MLGCDLPEKVDHTPGGDLGAIQVLELERVGAWRALTVTALRSSTRSSARSGTRSSTRSSTTVA